MKLKFIFKHVYMYLNDQSVDIRLRMMYFLEYASLIACLVGTIFMILLNQPAAAMIPNIILFVMSFISLYLSHIKKKYELSTLFLIVGCANIAVPWMFFTAGGNDSGMQIWFLFSVAITCMMSNGKIRILMASITTIEDLACICIGHFWPNTVAPLVGEDAVFADQVQSYAVVCVCLSAILIIYLSAYDIQQQKLQAQSLELRNLMQTDALTGKFNRHAYYEEINAYKSGAPLDGMVLVSMDVNGLKHINDTKGHAAGDEYICAAANAITQAFGDKGHIFRTGGDEFMAILGCSIEESHNIEEKLNECVANHNKSCSGSMAIAVGVVCCDEEMKKEQQITMSEIEKLADKRMYENKAAFYKRTGIDRRK